MGGGGYASGSFPPMYKKSCIIFDEHWTQHADCEDDNIFGDFLFMKKGQNVAVN